ncbi:MAG: prephenate dehydrogenase [Rhodoferax sp.]|nr:prephenate dehydrogenase [Rhodoferax sp.]
MIQQLGLIGCGLMGGSFALALRRAGWVRRVTGYSPSAHTLQRAQALGVIDEAADSAGAAAAGSDLVLLALPVGATGRALAAVREQLAPQAVVMDVGSTKGDVVAAAAQALGDRLGQFVPAHPMAGREVSGVEHAQASLYDGCLVILTPLADTRPQALDLARSLWQALGCRVIDMPPQAHDAAVAAVSHLPHLLAFALMNGLDSQPGAAASLAVAGPGFRDFSRIAASDPVMWRDILLANRQSVLAQSLSFRAALDRLEATLQRGDGPALEALIESARRLRTRWQAGQTGSLTPIGTHGPDGPGGPGATAAS